MFELDNVKNEAILRDFFIFQSWQHPKQSNSARLLQFLNLTTSKTKQFCETSLIFELDNIQNEAILRDFFNFWTWQHQKQSNSARLPSKMESWVQRWWPRTNAFRDLSIQCLWSTATASKNWGLYEALHLSRKIILANLQIWCSKMQPISGNQRPDLLTSLMNMSFVLRLPGDMHLCRSSSTVPRLPSFLEMLQNPHVLLTFDFEKVHNPLRLPHETTSEPPTVARTCSALYIFDFEMCFAPQRRALFHLSSGRFSEPTFRPSGATNHTKNTVFRDFPTFSCISIFFLLTLSLLSSSLFYSSLLSDSSHLCFSSVHIVGSLTSKLPSIISVVSDTRAANDSTNLQPVLWRRTSFP